MKIIPSVLRLSLVAVILFLALQCHKNDQITTSVSGRVYDRVTGEPIEGAKLDFIVVGLQYESENEILEHKYLTTTKNGIYETSYTGNDDSQLNHWTTTLPGYLTLVTVSGIEQNKHNKLDFEMIPIDGKIILTVKHLQSNKDSLYIRCSNDVYKSLQGAKIKDLSRKDGALSIAIGDSTTMVVDIPNSEKTYIHWGQIKPNIYNDNPFTNIDSISIARFSTVKYTIVY